MGLGLSGIPYPVLVLAQKGGVAAVVLPLVHTPRPRMLVLTTVSRVSSPPPHGHGVLAQIHKLAFSGSRGNTLEEHRRLGADLDVDVSYQYLRFFEPDDAKLADTGARYSKGEMLTGEIKNELVAVLQGVVSGHQTAKANVTDADIAYYMSTDPARFARA
eukprot:m.244693 g.244693  ORF g.244693 m.244693 type:complete len:160 (-) comp19476_c1_seq2:133-612(-)